MSLQVVLDLSPGDLDHFRNVMQQASEKSRESSEDRILEQARGVLEQGLAAKAPDFIKQRVAVLEKMVAMLDDRAWALEDDDRARVLAALAYFADPDDIIPDDVPVLGYLDDAIMIELIARELKPELEAYDEFCAFREAEATRRGEQITTMSRVDWLEQRRKELHSQMRQRRRRRSGHRSGRHASGGSGSWFSSF